MSKVWTDTELLALIDAECLDVRCHSVPIADTGDADVAWTVIEHHQADPKERVIGRGQTAREALIDSQMKPCTDCEGEGIIAPEDDGDAGHMCATCHGHGKV